MLNMGNRRNFGKAVQVDCDVGCWIVSPSLLVFGVLFLVIRGVEISTSFPLTTKKNRSLSTSQETNIYSIWSHSSSALETIHDFLIFVVVVCLFICFAWSSKFLRRAPTPLQANLHILCLQWGGLLTYLILIAWGLTMALLFPGSRRQCCIQKSSFHHWMFFHLPTHG